MDRLGGYFGAHEAEDPIDDYVDEDDTDMDAPPSPVGQDERRMQVRAYNHWASLLGERNYPDVADLEPDSLDDFGPYSVLLDFSDGIDDPVVQYVGTELSEECGHDELIVRLSDVPSRSVLSRITDHYMQILANQAPIGFEAEFMNERGVTVLYRGILLPYSSDNETIDFIYGVINWKEMADAATADELLREIGQSLGDYDEAEDETDGAHDALETAETLTSARDIDPDADDSEDSDILDLASADMVEADEEPGLPMPSFGAQAQHSGEAASSAGTDDDAAADSAARAHRSIDALGNPIGAHPGQDEPDYGGQESFDDYDGNSDSDSAIRTAADYGLPDFDEEPEGDDVDDLVDPLDDDEASSSLISLVSRGERTKKAVDLSLADPVPSIADDEPTITFPMPEAYSPPVEADEPVAGIDADHEPVEDAQEAIESGESHEISLDEPLPAIVVDPQDAPEGLYDCLAAAREQAQAAQNTEDRSRKALYAAVALAYDFSLETQDDPEGFNELLSDNGLTVQDRAPMTPVVKLVFGADYDKTRLTEYAAVLMHAHRLQVERGALASFLHAAEGGLKGVVQAERRARKEEQGKAVEDHNSVKSALARKLRELAPLSLADLADEGPEFALVMVRRTAEGDIVVLGELPEDIPALERSARKLIS